MPASELLSDWVLLPLRGGALGSCCNSGKCAGRKCALAFPGARLAQLDSTVLLQDVAPIPSRSIAATFLYMSIAQRLENSLKGINKRGNKVFALPCEAWLGVSLPNFSHAKCSSTEQTDISNWFVQLDRNTWFCNNSHFPCVRRGS